MTRVSTLGNYQSALLNLMQAQARGLEAQKRVSTEKVATDLSGYGRGAETLTALKSTQNRVNGFIETGKAVSARMTSQALAFDRVADAADGARQAIAEALAAGRADALMLEIQSYFQMAQDGLNAKHQDRYLFAGSNTDQAPVTASTLNDLLAAPDVASVFTNDQLASVSRLDESTTVQTGFLADAVGGDLFGVFRALQDYHTGPNGPIEGQIDDDLRDFLTAQLGALKTVHTGVIEQAARSGSVQSRAESILAAHEDQRVALQTLIGKRTDADLAQAITDLELSQISIQASAQVLAQLRNTSLLDLWR